MKARSIAISLVLLLSSACVVVDVGDDEVGEAPEESGTEESSSTDEAESTSTEADTSESANDTTDTDTDTDTGSESDTDTTDTDIGPGDCEGVGSSDLEGVCIWFPESGGSWTLDEVAQGIAIPYHVIVEADVPEVVPMPQDAGGCGQPDASGLIVFARLQGGGQEYCVCDIGICPGRPLPPMTLPAADTAFDFEWNGVNWGGPSDTNNPFGPPFPAGDYTLEISAEGTAGGVPFTVSNTFAVTLE